MAFITTILVEQASGDVRAMYEKNQAPLGYVPNYAKLFSHRPELMAAWAHLNHCVRAPLDIRRYELVTLAAARALHSSYCMLAHGSILCEQLYAPEQLQAILDDPTTAGLAPIDIAILAFAEQVARDAPSVTAGDIQKLRDYGLADSEIFDIAAAVAARCFFSTLLDALGAEPDAAYTRLETGLQQRLTVGRPISQAAVEQIPAK